MNLFVSLHGLASYIILLPGAPLPPQASFLWWYVFCVTVALVHCSTRQTLILRETVEATAAILKCPLLVSAKELRTNRLEHFGLHQCLAESSSFQSGHFACTKHNVLHQVTEDSIHSIGAGKTAWVKTKVSSATTHLHLSLQCMDDAVPKLSCTKWPRKACSSKTKQWLNKRIVLNIVLKPMT